MSSESNGNIYKKGKGELIVRRERSGPVYAVEGERGKQGLNLVGNDECRWCSRIRKRRGVMEK